MTTENSSTTTASLRDFEPDRVSYSTRDHLPDCYETIDDDVIDPDGAAAIDKIPSEWLDLNGYMGADGGWVWDGEGAPVDHDGRPLNSLRAWWVDRAAVVRDLYLAAAARYGCIDSRRAPAPDEPYILVSLLDPDFRRRDPNSIDTYRGAESAAWVDVSIVDGGNTETVEYFGLDLGVEGNVCGPDQLARDLAEERQWPFYRLRPGGRYEIVNIDDCLDWARAEIAELAGECDDLTKLRGVIDDLSS